MSIRAEVAIPVHPGEILQDMLDEQKITQTAFARWIGVDQSTINDICRGRRGISAAMAVKVARAFGYTPAQFWLNLQTDWDLSQLDESEGAGIEPMRKKA